MALSPNHRVLTNVAFLWPINHFLSTIGAALRILLLSTVNVVAIESPKLSSKTAVYKPLYGRVGASFCAADDAGVDRQ